MKRSKGFTLIELLVVVAIIALLVSILLPAVNKAKEITKQTLCMTRVKGLGKAAVMYKMENDDAFAQIRPACETTIGTFIQADVWYDGSTPGVAHNPVLPRLHTRWGTATQVNFFLLITSNFVEDKHFICPSSDDKITERYDSSGSAQGEFGFGGSDNISYGIQKYGDQLGRSLNYPNPNISGPFYDLRDTVAIVADKGAHYASGSDPDFELQSPNHMEVGQAVLYVGTQVEFARKLSVGHDQNLIWEKDMVLGPNSITLTSRSGGSEPTPGNGDGWENADEPTSGKGCDVDSIIVWAPDS